jgi:putative endonuclease
MTVARQARGRRGEDLVAHWYTRRGYRVLDRNWRSRQGELDLVVEASGLLVFCEVKTRTSDRFGTPAEAVTREKQLRIRRLAREWMTVTRTRAPQVRFDVASVLLGSDGPTVDVLVDAF